MKQELAIGEVAGPVLNNRSRDAAPGPGWSAGRGGVAGHRDWFQAFGVAMLVHVGGGFCAAFLFCHLWSGTVSVPGRDTINLDLGVVSAQVRPPSPAPAPRDQVATPAEERRVPPALTVAEEIARAVPPDVALSPRLPPSTPLPSCEVRPDSVVPAIAGGALPEFTVGNGSVETGTSGPSVQAVPASGTGGQGDVPMALSEIRPRYPFRSRSDGEEGTVTVRVRVNGEGVIQNVGVTRTSGFSALDAAAVASVRKARFAPARKDGRPVDGEISLTFQFTLRD